MSERSKKASHAVSNEEIRLLLSLTRDTVQKEFPSCDEVSTRQLAKGSISAYCLHPLRLIRELVFKVGEKNSDLDGLWLTYSKIRATVFGLVP